MRGCCVLNLRPRVKVLVGVRILVLPAELARIDAPHRVGTTRSDTSTTVPDDVHDVECHTIEHVQNVLLYRDEREGLRRLHQGHCVVHLVGVAILCVVHELRQHLAPKVRMRLVPGVEDPEEHVLGRGVVLLARADVSIAELQQVHGKVQATALAAHTGVGHQQTLLHEDFGVAVFQAPVEVAHLNVGGVAFTDELDELAGARDLDSQLAVLAVLLDRKGRDLLRRARAPLLQLLPELRLELLGCVPATPKSELHTRLGIGGAVHHLGAAHALLLLHGLLRDQAHACFPGALLAAWQLAHELQQGRRRVVQDQHLVTVDIHILTHDLPIAEPCHLPIGLHRAEPEVGLGVLLVDRGDAVAPRGRGRLLVTQALQEVFVLALHRAQHAPPDLLGGQGLGLGVVGHQRRPLRLGLLLE
mmetsp:Transcript_4356/g.13603  ORF Transcript_4356/g.13603 Transcript_4356/m.13603 type:complete len:416 (+) Transcript_4356:1499-2746(+)